MDFASWIGYDCRAPVLGPCTAHLQSSAYAIGIVHPSESDFQIERAGNADSAVWNDATIDVVLRRDQRAIARTDMLEHKHHSDADCVDVGGKPRELWVSGPHGWIN